MDFRPFIPAVRPGDVAHYWRDDGQGGGEILSVQDVAPILDQNKAAATHDDGYSPSRDMRRVAFVPNGVIAQWLKEGFDMFDKNNAKELRRRLNSSDWAHLRTAPGRL